MDRTFPPFKWDMGSFLIREHVSSCCRRDTQQDRPDLILTFLFCFVFCFSCQKVCIVFLIPLSLLLSVKTYCINHYIKLSLSLFITSSGMTAESKLTASSSSHLLILLSLSSHKLNGKEAEKEGDTLRKAAKPVPFPFSSLLIVRVLLLHVTGTT